jgi:hypothetical protein
MLYFNKIFEFVDIIHHPVFFYLKYNVSETGFCLRLQIKAYSDGSSWQS